MPGKRSKTCVVFEVIATSTLKEFDIKSVIDVGCGTVDCLRYFIKMVVQFWDLRNQSCITILQARQINVLELDLEKDEFNINQTFDLAISLEVAEHLPPSITNRYVELLSRLSDVIMFTAAPPGQGGKDHVNEQPASYWISRFQYHGYTVADEFTQRLRRIWKSSGEVHQWYHKTF